MKKIGQNLLVFVVVVTATTVALAISGPNGGPEEVASAPAIVATAI